ncbi:MAG: hypothetical protein WA702_08925 [Bradyrhizobium sp.]|uniref:hypothetical protein n=1 Tax=Bradyrhizobium sp. TaxID=376 RepID=UPI003C7ACCD4
MSKRKTTKPRKTAAGATVIAEPTSRPKRAVPVPAMTGSEAEELQADTSTETRLPEFLGHKTDDKLSPVPPVELELQPVLPPGIAEPKPDVALPVEARSEAEESVEAAPGEARMASSSSSMESPPAGPLRAMAGMEACQKLLMEMTRDNLDLAASLASMRSPLDIVDVATKFAGRQVGMYGRFSKAVADIAAGRQQT